MNLNPIPPDENHSQHSFPPIDYTESPLLFDSEFYIERPPYEARALAEITQPGSFITIKAPKKMGKTSLVLRLIHQADDLDYHTVLLDFQQANTKVFTNSYTFLHWFCNQVARQLDLRVDFHDYWRADMGIKTSSSIYFEEYLLPSLDQPLLLVLDEVNLIFNTDQIAQEFFALLRFWQEKSRQFTLWKKLHLVLVLSTEPSQSLGLDHFLFNMGLILNLPEFTPEQIEELAHRYQLNLSSENFYKLINLIGGNPYLIHRAIHYLSSGKEPLELFLKNAPTSRGIYSRHYQNQRINLQKKPELVTALREIINAKEPLQIQPLITEQLRSMGLIKSEENKIKISCNLYDLYFRSLKVEENLIPPLSIPKLENKNKQVQNLVYMDPLTRLWNRLHFDQCLQIEWECMILKETPLSLIICDLDQFKIYNEIYGRKMGDDCLKKVAQAIRQTLKRPSDVVARYSGDEFVIILPQTDATGALYVAEKIRASVKSLDISFHLPTPPRHDDQIITISLGIACVNPPKDPHPKTLLLAADQALLASQRAGGDRCTLSQTFNYSHASSELH